MFDPFVLADHPVHLGRGATAAVQPPFTRDMAWYAAYGDRHGGDGADGWLVAQHEVVVCLSGEMVLHRESADIETSASALFITAGLGTENRPR